LPAKLVALHGISTVVLLDLSLTGARLQMPERCPFADELKPRGNAEFQWFEFEAFCTIQWVQKVDRLFEVGLNFDVPLNPKVVIATRDIYDQYREEGGYTATVQESAQDWVRGI
jgi:hypothetical protein